MDAGFHRHDGLKLSDLSENRFERLAFD